MARTVLVSCLLAVASAQQAGEIKEESHRPITLEVCTKSGGCVGKSRLLTMDAQWRWLHDAQKNHYKNCISGTPPSWDDEICSSGSACASGCAIEGINDDDYEHTYGIKTVPGGVDLKFKNGESIGSRLYMLRDESHYEMFQLLNKEFTLEVDVSTLQCGINGAVYFVEMDEDGGMSKGDNTAGAKYGTGYCDAQCPHDLKFIQGEANYKDWHETDFGPEGHYGSCCAELDIWEANKEATAFTTHACDIVGPLRCEGTGANKCGDTPADCKCCGEQDCSCCGRYKGVCDKDGCDYNHFRLGEEDYYGDGPGFTVDTSKPITVVTQFLTTDGTDSGDLKEMRRLYVQDGKVIQNSKVKNLDGYDGDSINNEMCDAQKKTFDNTDDFTPKGKMAGMGEAMKRGMVLVLSLWDDMKTQMEWLDSASPTDQPERFPLTKPGVRRGPCKKGDGDPHKLRTKYPNAHVTYRNIRIGEIDSTYTKKAEEDAEKIDEGEGGGLDGEGGGGDHHREGGGGEEEEHGGGGREDALDEAGAAQSRRHLKCSLLVPGLDASAVGPELRGAVGRALAAGLPRVEEGDLRVVRVLAAEGAGGGKHWPPGRKGASKPVVEQKGKTAIVEFVVEAPTGARANFLDRVEARLILLGQGGASAGHFSEAFLTALGRAGAKLPPGTLIERVELGEPQQVLPRKAGRHLSASVAVGDHGILVGSEDEAMEAAALDATGAAAIAAALCLAVAVAAALALGACRGGSATKALASLEGVHVQGGSL